MHNGHKLINVSQSKIFNFYKNQNVLVTGVTGFLGKVLVEKLLRSTDVSKIFCLIRPHNHRDIKKVADEILDLPLFDIVKKEKPSFKNRVVPISGDCTLSDLGLSPQTQKLVSSVNTVFHLAATVRFNENIKLAFDINVKGTQNIISLCSKLQDLKSFIVVSTAYSNCHRDNVDEIIYDFPVPYEELENKLRNCSYEEAEKITPKLLHPWPNTYTFTKALSESQIKSTKAGNLPIGIFRPAIITSTYKEPIPDWVDSMGGAGTPIGFTSLGIAKVFPYDSQKNSDFVPADLVVAALIAIGWDASERKDLPVYNYVSSIDNPIKASEFLKICNWNFREYPLKRAKSAPKLILVENLTAYNILSLWYHYLPAILMDLKSVLFLKKPKSLTTMRQIDEIYKMFFYFAIRSWKFKNDNVKHLWKKMNDEDKKLFPFDITKVNWLQHCRGYVKGLRLYFFKDLLSTLEEARIRSQRFEMTYKFLVTLLCFIAANVLGSLLGKII